MVTQCRRALGAALCAACVAAIVAGCARTRDGAAPDARAAKARLPSVASRPTGEQLWSQNCTRCHNARSPRQYSDVQWEIIVHHMRLRANLTGNEERQITSFLQSGD